MLANEAELQTSDESASIRELPSAPRVLTRSCPRGILVILCYHRVLPNKHEASSMPLIPVVTLGACRQHHTLFGRCFGLLSLRTIHRRLAGGKTDRPTSANPHAPFFVLAKLLLLVVDVHYWLSPRHGRSPAFVKHKDIQPQ